MLLSNPPNLPSSISMRTTALFSPLNVLRIHSLFRLKPLLPHPLPFPTLRRFPSPLLSRFSSLSNSVEHVQGKWDLQSDLDEPTPASKLFDFDAGDGDLKHLNSVPVEVKELEDLPEQWRRSKIAWLCKELPAHKSSTFVRILNAQRKWMTQEDITYVAVHCMRIRENEAAFKVYKWMMQQPKFKFDFALATKLADYMGKERKFLRCREIFDDIINQGRVPSDSTFHVLIVAYLSSSAPWCLVEACTIYNRMIQLGGYQPRLHLHNSLFKALVSDVGGSSKHNLKQTEFIFHNMVTSGLEVGKDIYGGLIWLHSNQDNIDKERIEALRKEMSRLGMEEGKDVLLSILRACCKEGNVEEAEKIWSKLIHSEGGLPSQAFVYKMEVYAKAGDPMRSLKTFREMQTTLSRTSVAAYHKIIDVLSKAQEIELAESLITEFVESGLKPLMPSFIDLMTMYLSLGLNDKLEFMFYQSLEKGSPNRTVYSIYLDSLVKTGNLVKAEEIFNQMLSNEAVGVNTQSCNSLLRGHITSGDYVKAEKIYDLMCQKKYDIEADLMEKLDFVLSLSRKVVKKPISLKLSKEKREMLVGLLLGGLQIESDEERRNHAIYFEFKQNHGTHICLKRHLYDQFHEWLSNSCRPTPGDDIIPDRFFTISHTYFGFYADQFWPKGRSMIPKLIHRWLSPRVLAYWYMYAGHRTSSGDILLKVKGDPQGVEKIVKTLRAKSLDCKVKRKGRVFWIGFLGSNSTWFWKLTDPYILDEIKDLLKPGQETLGNGTPETPTVSFDGASDSDENSFDYSDNNS